MPRFPCQYVLSLLSCLLVAAVPASATEVNSDITRAADFTLLDQNGKAFNLHYHAQRPAVVLMAHTSGSAFVQQSLAALSAGSGEEVVLGLLNAEGSVRGMESGISMLQDDAGCC